MSIPFVIKYRVHWCGPCKEFDDTKRETIIRSDGCVLVRRYDHHGPNGHYRIVERGTGLLPVDEVADLYKNIQDLIKRRTECLILINDASAEVIIEELGLKISVDGGLSDGEITCDSLLEECIRSMKLDWHSVGKK